MKTPRQPKQHSDDRKIALSKLVSLCDIIDEIPEALLEDGKTEAFPTGWTQFNKYIGGGFGKKQEGELIVVAGETGIGKSTLAANIAMHVAMQGHKIDYITLEDSRRRTFINLMKAGGMSDPKDMLQYKDTIFTPSNELLHSEEGWDTEDLLEHMNFQQEARGIRFVVIDHLNFMFENEEQLRDENIRVRVTMKKLSNFAVRNNVTILAVSHMNKAPQTIKQQEPNLDRIYGSSGIVQASTKTLLLWRPADQSSDDTPIVLVRLAKSRHTATRREWFEFDCTDTQWNEIGIRLI